MLYQYLQEIARPLHVHGVKSADEYENLQRYYLSRQQASRPEMGARLAWKNPNTIKAWIAGGKWIVSCMCGNAPSASPEWNIARCLECGAVHEDIIWPEDREAVEKYLVTLPVNQRSILAGQTLKDIRGDKS